MRKILALTLSVLLAVLALTVPVYAEDIVTDEPITVATAEIVTENAEIVTEQAAHVTEPTESETTVPSDEPVHIDQWIYDVMKQATPEQVELIEDIVLGGLNALDSLEIEGFDRVRIWVEHNMATVMVGSLTVALVAFFVATILQKKGFAKKADLLNHNAIELYKEGQANAEATQAACKEYVDRADEVCRECAQVARLAAESAQAAQGQVTEERALLIAELNKNAKINAAMCETVNFLLQCSDLSQSKRDEAEAIFKKGLEAIQSDEHNQA